MCLQDLRKVNPGHEQFIDFSDIVIVYVIPVLPGTLYVVMGGNL